MDHPANSTQVIKWGGESLHLLPEKVIYIPRYEYLLISDMHLGKAAHFRKNGIGLPGEVSQKDIEDFAMLMDTFQPKKVLFMGDLFHSEYNAVWPQFLKVLILYADTEFCLVKGNHDILSSDLYHHFEVVNEYYIGDILCTHEPMSVINNEKYNLCGHIHPAVRLTGKGRQYMTLPCYFFGSQQAIMPAFGSFTGVYKVQPQKDDKVYVIADQAVTRVH